MTVLLTYIHITYNKHKNSMNYLLRGSLGLSIL